MRPKWLALSAAVTILIGGISYSLWHGSAVAKAAGTTSVAIAKKVSIFPAVGHMAPNFALKTLSGKTVSLKSLRGKPVYVNFWATWCTYCKAELQAIQRLHQHYGKKLVILGVDLTASEKSPQAVAQFVTQQKLTYDILLDTTGSVANQYLVRAAPTSVFVNPKGLITTFFVGQMSHSQMVKAYRSAK